MAASADQLKEGILTLADRRNEPVTSSQGDQETTRRPPALPKLVQFKYDDWKMCKEDAMAAEIAKRVQYFTCPYGCGSRVSVDNKEHTQNCLYRPKLIHCVFEKDDNGHECDWTGTVYDLISSHVNLHKRNLVILQNCNEFMIRLLEKEPIKLLILYNISYLKNEAYWMRLFETDGEHNYVVVEHIGSVFNQEPSSTITLGSYWVTYVDSPNLGNIGRIVDGSLSDEERLNSSVFITPLLKPKSPLMVQFIRNSEIPQNIAILLECPVCTEMMTSDIVQCERGHSICYECRKSIEDCPTCKGAMTTARNFGLEQLWAAYNNVCKYRKAGCTDELNVRNLKEHQEHCWFRDVMCPACHWTGPWPTFLYHENCDRRYLVPKQILHVDLLKIQDDSQTICFICQAYNSVFIITVTLTGNIIYLDVAQMTADVREHKFKYTLRLHNDLHSVKFSGTCTNMLNDQPSTSGSMILNTTKFEDTEGEIVKFYMTFDAFFVIEN